MIIVIITPLTTAQTADSSTNQTASESTSPTLTPVKVETKDKDNGIKSRSQSKDSEINQFVIDKNLTILEISWRAGEKSLFSFRGQQYKLEIHHGKKENKIVKAVFTFKDTKDRNNSISVKKSFKPPFSEPMGTELNKWYDLVLANLSDKQPAADSRLVDNFEISEFYQKYVKPLASQQISK